jgi:hypothetical protein
MAGRPGASSAAAPACRGGAERGRGKDARGRPQTGHRARGDVDCRGASRACVRRPACKAPPPSLTASTHCPSTNEADAPPPVSEINERGSGGRVLGWEQVGIGVGNRGGVLRFGKWVGPYIDTYGPFSILTRVASMPAGKGCNLLAARGRMLMPVPAPAGGFCCPYPRPSGRVPADTRACGQNCHLPIHRCPSLIHRPSESSARISRPN